MSDWREEYENLPEVRAYTELVKRVLDKPSIKLQIVVWTLIILGIASLPFILYGLDCLWSSYTNSPPMRQQFPPGP